MGENLAYYIRKIESMVGNYEDGMSEYEIVMMLGISGSSWDKIKRMLKQDPNLEHDSVNKIWKSTKRVEKNDLQEVS